METERPRMTRSRSKSQSRAVAAAEAGDDAAPSGPNVNGEVGGTFADEIDAPKRQGDADEKVDGIERVEDEEDKADDVRADKDKEEKVDKESDVTEEVDTSKDSPETPKKDTENVAAEPNEEKPDKDLNGSQKQPSEAPETPPATLGRGRRSRILNSVHGSTEDSEKSGESIKAATETKPKPRGRKRKVTEVPEAETGEKDVTDSKEKDEEEASSQGTEEHNESKKAESIEGSMDPDLDLPPKQTLGKGKRARIPNRKYGDIPVTVTPKSTVTENGSEKLKSDSESLDFSSHEETSAGYTSGMLSLSPSGNTPQSKKQKITNLKDPKYLKPFEYGWKRELVFRGTSDSKLKRNADVYYFSPDKKKVRSMREVVENLKTKMLSVDNFTFFKEAIGLNDPEKEIIRSAAKRTNTPTLPDKEVAHKAEPLPKGRKAKSPSQKAMSPQVSTQKVTSPKLNLIDEETPELKVKLPTKKSAKRVEKDEETTEAVTTPSKGPSTKTPAKAANFSNKEDKPCQPCSIRCEGVRGLVPTLQCSICLCLYHHECVGLAPHLTTYVCKKCRQDRKPIQSTPLVAPPPLTPINSLKPASAQSATNLTALPKLQRIPKADDPPPGPPPEEESPAPLPAAPLPSPPPPPPPPSSPPPQDPPRLTPRPPDQAEPVVVQEPPPTVAHKSIVGSVTTWLPQNAKIVDQIGGDEAATATEVPRPQYVEYLNGRKFLVIPKHNFMSVSPGLAATAAVTRPLSGLTGADVETAITPIQPEPSFPSNPENSQTADAMEVEHAKRKAAAEDDADATDKTAESRSAKRARLSVTAASAPTSVEEKSSSSQPVNHFQNLAYGYSTLLQVFQYLKVQDLLRAGCVCTMWRDVMSNPTLWRTVRMKNSQVHSFEGLANMLKKHCTKHLDLRKVLLPNGGDEIWPEFSKAIEKVDTLRRIELCRCPASVVEKLAVSNPQLEVLNAVTIKCETLDLTPFKSLTEVKELRLKSTTGFTVSSNLDSLKEMKSLVHLSLTSVKELDKMNLSTIAELTELESLDLGECTDFPKEFGEKILVKLTKLEKLRLEKGQGNCYTFEILEAVRSMPRLEQLELVNFDIKAGFDKALGACQNIKKLLLIPTYISQSATTNHMLLGGVVRLQHSLTHFVWGVTLELLRVTELFIDQCEEMEKKERKEVKSGGGAGDFIPVLKPTPLIREKDAEIPPAYDPPQVEIFHLTRLQKLLMMNLPTTRVKILKIPFHATWRQSITDSVN